MEICNATLLELSKLLGEKRISSCELTKLFLQRIREKNGELGAFITVCEGKAYDMAKRADDMLANGKKTAITGIPVGVKDNICTVKIRTTCASKMLQNYIPAYDAAVVENIKKEGAVILGKTNLDEFAMGAFGTDSALLTSKNPINTEFVAGGSSSGSAVAVASGMCPVTLGSDTGGSVRVPASFCGICGFKPSYGAISRFGLVAYASSLDTVGVLAKTAGDIFAFSKSVCKKDSRDMTSVEVCDVCDVTSLSGIRFAFCEDDFKNAKNEIQTSLKRFAEFLSRAGLVRVEKSAFCDSDMDKHYTSLVCAEAMSNLSRYDGIKYGYREFESVEENRQNAFGPEVRKRIEYGNYVLREENFKSVYEAAVKSRNRASREVETLFDECDIAVTPLCDFEVPKTGETGGLRADKFTVLANFTGIPALSMPIGRDKNGMPISVQLMSKRFSDFTLLKISALVEKLLREEGVYEL